MKYNLLILLILFSILMWVQCIRCRWFIRSKFFW